MKRVAVLTVAAALLCACATPTQPANTPDTATQVGADPRPTTGPATIHITSPYPTCGVIDEVDRKAALRSEVQPSAWMADKPEAVYADEVDGELIGAPRSYSAPPASFKVSSAARALVVCFHSATNTYNETLTSGSINRPVQYGEYSYEFVEVTPGGVHQVVVDEDSPQEWTCYGSCPFVYLDQGGETLALGEILKDAIGPGMERVDAMTLPNTRGRDRIEVRIQEEIEGETSHLNLVRLKTASGRTVAPAQARHPTLGDADLKARLATADDRAVTLELGQTLHLVFELDRPADADLTLEVGGHYRLTPGLANRPRAAR